MKSRDRKAEKIRRRFLGLGWHQVLVLDNDHHFEVLLWHFPITKDARAMIPTEKNLQLVTWAGEPYDATPHFEMRGVKYPSPYQAPNVR